MLFLPKILFEKFFWESDLEKCWKIRIWMPRLSRIQMRTSLAKRQMSPYGCTVAESDGAGSRAWSVADRALRGRCSQALGPITTGAFWSTRFFRTDYLNIGSKCPSFFPFFPFSRAAVNVLIIIFSKISQISPQYSHCDITQVKSIETMWNSEGIRRFFVEIQKLN